MRDFNHLIKSLVALSFICLILIPTHLGATIYITTEDNENNAGSGKSDGDMDLVSPPCVFNTSNNHPIEFNIDVTGALPTQNAYLSLLIGDIDWPSEYDEVFINGHSLGPAIGQNNLNYSTLFIIPDLSWIVQGNNLIQIYVDKNYSGYWCAQVRFGQLIIDEGLGSGTACIRTATSNANQYKFGDPGTIDLEVDTSLTSQNVRLELILRDPNGIIKTFDTNGKALRWTINGTDDEPYSWTFTLPSSGTSGLWGVTISVYDADNNHFQATQTIAFAVPVGSYFPVINSITPNSGLYGAATAVTIDGQNFIPGNTTCTVGSISLSNLIVVNTNTITGNVSTSLASGPHDVTCTTLYGSNTLVNGFTILSTIPAVTTTPISNITPYTASSGGNVTSEGSSAVTARGVCWSTSANPTTADSHTTDGTGTGIFTSVLTGLTPNTTYYVRAYATNASGSGYGDEVIFITAVNPTISGKVTDGTNPIKGVTITFSHDGHTETTNGNGHYSYTVVYGTTTTVTPSKTGYSSWNPAKKTFNNIISNKVQNFTVSLNTYTISGKVTDGTNPIEGVTITFSHDGHTETTDSNGNYSYTVTYGTTATVTASKPGYTFEPPEYSYTNLMENKPNQDFTVINFVSIIITNPQNGGTVSGEVIINAEVSSQDASTAYAYIQAVTKVEFYIDGVFVKKDTRPSYQHRWDTTLVPNGSYTIKAKAFHSSGLTNQHEITVNVNNTTAPPHIQLNRTRLNYGTVIGESQTGSQTFLISNSGGCCLNWTASVSDAWIKASPLSGTANMLVTVSVDVTGLAKGSYTGTVTITDANADNSPGSVDIYLVVIEKAQELPLFGSFDSPKHGADVCSVVPVTGWALDDIEVSDVKIFRNPVPGHETGLIYIGDAVFMEGARPDVEGKYSEYPKHYQAGWSYKMLTNFLPGDGNGNYVITAIATDSSGNEVTLGSKTIICDNANAVKPFGAIDIPTQGGDAFGADFVNFGWALTPLPNTIPTDGSTIKVWVDGVPLPGNPVYNQYREDIVLRFPGYNNSNGAGGYYYLDTTLYANGIHTISWSATDDGGNTDGIGSRYFRIMNVENPSAASAAAFGYQGNLSIQNLPVSRAAVYLDKGYKTGIERKHHRQTLYPDNEEAINIVIKEEERIEIGLNDDNENALSTNRWSGFHLIGDAAKPLPVGSFLDVLNGIFYWQPGPGFIGQYRFVFVEKGQNGELEKKMINVVIEPKF